VHAIDVLRSDGLNSEREHQFMERFRRERNPARQDRSRVRAYWGDIAGDNNEYERDGRSMLGLASPRNRDQASNGSGTERGREQRPGVGFGLFRRVSSPTRALAGREEDRAQVAATDLHAIRAEGHERQRARIQRLQQQHFMNESPSMGLPWPPTPRRRGDRLAEMMVS
jgi:hypothetical protein